MASLCASLLKQGKQSLGASSILRQLSRQISRGRGHIVAVSSMAAVVPAPGQALYSASKAALNAYLATLQTELCARCGPAVQAPIQLRGPQYQDTPEKQTESQ